MSIPASNEDREADDVLKEGLFRHQKGTTKRMMSPRVSIPSSKGDDEADDEPKECLCRHQTRRMKRMMSSKSVYPGIKQGRRSG
ncbi:hypothetical protein ACOJQI_20815 [Bacillus salacetis]|uniref:hypothetical protein n=1 Tax=Bacillus salacetis TaxID=2315464 RepID=UPI003B9F6E01